MHALVPRLRLLAIFEGLWSLPPLVELLTELLRGGLVHKLLSMTLSDVTPQHLSAQDKRVYLAHVLQRGVFVAAPGRPDYFGTVGRRTVLDECVIPPFRLLVYRQEMDHVVPTLVDNYSKRYDFWRRSYFCPHGPHRQWSISAVVAHKVAVQWS